MSKFSKIIIFDKEMQELTQNLKQESNSDSNILILGETGTGKNLLARYIYETRGQKEGSFKTLFCPGLGNELVKLQLFFNSSVAFKKDTILIDEITDLSMVLQGRLSQFIEERQFIRIIASANPDLVDRVKKGTFSKELYHQLKVVEINIPPLRERYEDIKPLVYFFLTKFNKKHNVSHFISEECLNILHQYNWPGNIRELENLIERLVVTVEENEIKPCHLPKIVVANLQQNEKS